jgi:DNA helicase-2/ATP-dependent DNA helicase PcrA
LPGVGGKTADNLWRKFESQLDAPDIEIPVALQHCSEIVPKKTATAWAQYVATVAQLAAPKLSDQPGDRIRLVLEAGYEDHLKASYANYKARFEDLTQLANFAAQFDATEEFLAQLALLTNIESEAERPAPADHEQMRLSTIHQAKGLEFRVVFVVMLCEGLFPSARSLETPDGEEEERRLFYVAITRAKDELYLSYPTLRMLPGRQGDVMQRPSRFLGEIPEALRESWDLRPYQSFA